MIAFSSKPGPFGKSEQEKKKGGGGGKKISCINPSSYSFLILYHCAAGRYTVYIKKKNIKSDRWRTARGLADLYLRKHKNVYLH